MRFILDYFTGGNVKVASAALVKLHFQYNEDYMRVYLARMRWICRKMLSASDERRDETVRIICANELKSYVDVAVLDLYLNPALDLSSYQQAISNFSDESATYFMRKYIPDICIYGDNRHLTKFFADSLQKLGKDQGNMSRL